jgi:hypothetical protein
VNPKALAKGIPWEEFTFLKPFFFSSEKTVFLVFQKNESGFPVTTDPKGESYL